MTAVHSATAAASGPPAPGGFTLIEILITIVVLAFGSLASLQMQRAALSGGAQAERLTVATTLAESEMERLKSLTFEELTAEAAGGPRVRANLNRLGQSCPTGKSCSGHIYAKTVNYFPGRPTSRSLQVEIRVSWNDAKGAKSLLYNGLLTSFSF